MTVPATAFQQAAQRQDPAVFDYVREVQQVWRDFPETKTRVYFLDLKTDRYVSSGDPEMARNLSCIMQDRSVKKTVQDCRKYEYPCYLPLGNRALLLPQNHEGLMLLYPQKRFNLLAETSELAQENIFAFDHEFGHALMLDTNFYLAECIGDAYAVIRHLQRYGAQSTAIDDLAAHRAMHLIFGDDFSHFTSPVVEAILARRYEIDWNSLTPEKTKELAHQFALKYALSPKNLTKLQVIFREWRPKMRALQKRTVRGFLSSVFARFYNDRDLIKKGDMVTFRALAAEMLSTNNAEEFKWGTAVLQLALAGHMKESYGIVLTGDEWKDLPRQLAEKQKSFKTGA